MLLYTAFGAQRRMCDVVFSKLCSSGAFTSAGCTQLPSLSLDAAGNCANLATHGARNNDAEEA
ncbi:hypothetical protein ACVIYL_004515 [Bradyrhizobium sp. USDA 3315]